MVTVKVLSVALLTIAAIGLTYYYVLLVAGKRPQHGFYEAGSVSSDALLFAVVVPAHNEAAVIGPTVTRLRDMAYPQDKYDIHVIADHCSDSTAQIASSRGAIVHERSCLPRGRKGYPLAWIFPRLLSEPWDYDAVVVFDADSRVDPGFLSFMSQALAAGAQVVQGRHVISNPDDSLFSGLAEADMRVNNRIHNQAKENLGLSARLMGDGMCFSRSVLETHPFSADSLTEDREYGISLVLHGIRVRYVADAVSVGQAVKRWGHATKQRLRWYAGVSDLQRRHLRLLLSQAWKARSAAAFDCVLELALPSFSTLCLLIATQVAILIATTGWRIPGLLWSSVLLASATAAYPFLGLLLEHAKPSAFLVLVFGPAYAVWRVWVGLLSRLQGDRVTWVRTQRVEEEELIR